MHRERVVSLTSALAFAGFAFGLALFPFHGLTAARAVPLVLAFAAASLVEFELGSGMAVPTQIVFVPMLLLMPPGIVPLAVMAGYALAEVIRAVRTRTAAIRLTMLLGSCWFAVGPSVVLVLGGQPAPSWHHWPLYTVAFAAQVVCDTAVTVASEWFAYGVRAERSLRAVMWAYSVDAMLCPIGVVFAVTAERTPAAVLAIMPLLGVLVWFARDRRGHVDALLDLNRAYRGTALVLGSVIEADDSYTGAHSRNVLELSLAIADRLGVDEASRREVEFTALLHDVGKLHIPNEIINKPGPLTAEERTLMETHTLQGERLLAEIGGFLANIGRFVRACHERWDGAGYPDGLRGDEIPLAARIVFCCDAYDAMTTDRPYRKARPGVDALDELAAQAGAQFDPVVVSALEEIIRRDLAARAADPDASGDQSGLRAHPAGELLARPDDADVDGRIAGTLRDRERVERVRERARIAPAAATYAGGGAFAVAALALPFLSRVPLASVHVLGVTAALVAAYAFVYGVNFQLGPGSAIPVQLAFIPMLVLMPPALVPLAVGLGILLRSGWDPAAVTCPARQRPFALLAGGWYAVGPTLLLMFGPSGRLDWPLLAVAVLLQLAVDAAVNVARVHVMLGFPLGALVRALAWTYAADIALTPIAFTEAAPGRVGTVPAVASGAALAGFLALLAWERNRQIAHAHELTDAYSAASEQARRDAVTGLLNRLAWDEAVAEVASGAPAAVVLLDVDGLKTANDSRGHAFGDLLLTEVGETIAVCLVGAGVSARIGGDEFGILLTGEDVDPAALVRRLRAEFDAHQGLDGFTVNASIGHAETPPLRDLAAAIEAADLAAYAEKRDSAAGRRAA